MQFATPAQHFKYWGDVMVKVQTMERILEDFKRLTDEFCLVPTLENLRRVKLECLHGEFTTLDVGYGTIEEHIYAQPRTLMALVAAQRARQYESFRDIATIVNDISKRMEEEAVKHEAKLIEKIARLESVIGR